MSKSAKTKLDFGARVAQAASLGDDTGPAAKNRFDHARGIVSAVPNGLTAEAETPVAVAIEAVAPAAPPVVVEQVRVVSGVVIPRGTRDQYYIEADVSLVDPNPFGARHIYPAARVAELAESIKKNGQDTPGTATIRNGRFVLSAGETRRRAIQLAGIATIRLMVCEDMTDQELYETSLRENDAHRPQTALDNALAWRNLLDQGLYANETELAEKIGKSLPTVNKTLKILELPEKIIESIKESPEDFAMSTLYELTQLALVANEHELITMVGRIKEEDAGRADVQRRRAELEAAQNHVPRKRAAQTRQYPISLKGTKVGYIKEFDSGKLELDISGLTTEVKEDLIEAIKGKLMKADFTVT